MANSAVVSIDSARERQDSGESLRESTHSIERDTEFATFLGPTPALHIFPIDVPQNGHVSGDGDSGPAPLPLGSGFQSALEEVMDTIPIENGAHEGTAQLIFQVECR